MKNRAVIYLIAALIINIFIVLTYSRFPIVVTLVVDILFFIKLNKRSKIKVLIAVASIATIVVVVSLIKGGNIITNLFDNIISIFKGESESKQENTSFYRLSLFKYARRVIGADYLFGRGLHLNTTFIIPSPNYGLFQSNSFDNGYLYLFLQQGILGVVAWILFCYSIIASGILSYKKGFNDDVIIPIIILVFICLVNMFSVARMDESRLFMIITGCYLGLDFHIFKFEESDSTPKEKKKKKALAVK